MQEELPPAEDIKKVERKVAKDEKQLQEKSQRRPKEIDSSNNQ